MSAEPAAVDVDRQHGVTVNWVDGHVSRFGLEELRRSCQCAQCRGRRQEGLPIWPVAGSPQPLRIVTAEYAGNWGLSLEWNDGHTAGIFAWETLRAWCPCAECEP